MQINSTSTDTNTAGSAPPEVSLSENTEHPDIVLQKDVALAVVAGKPFTKLPDNLYIPPDALEVFLESFEGPLDILLYLIRRQNIDILNIPIAEITRQYMEYVELMQTIRLELAAEYLVMAAILAEIKSKLLLPKTTVAGEEEEDPRAELIRRLQEYERYKKAAVELNGLPRFGRDVFGPGIECDQQQTIVKHPNISLQELLFALKEVMERAKMFTHHHVQKEMLSVRERMTAILDHLQTNNNFVEFSTLFRIEEGRMGVVVTFLAILELTKSTLIDLIQTEPFGIIRVKTVTASQS